PPMPPPSPYTTLFRSRIRLPIERLRRSRRALPYVRPLSTTGHRVHRSFVCHHVTSHSKQGRGGTSKCPAPPSPSRMRVMAEPLGGKPCRIPWQNPGCECGNPHQLQPVVSPQVRHT